MELLEAINKSTCFCRYKVPSPLALGQGEERKGEEKRKGGGMSCAGCWAGEKDTGKHKADVECPRKSTHSCSLSSPSLFPTSSQVLR
jgi:hypothetical protein